jgi:hypothetical protein
MKHINGKGMYLWIIWRILDGDVQAIADAAEQAGLTHVLIKAVDGLVNYNIKDGVDYVPPMVEAFKAKGIQPWIWQYTYAYRPKDEAKMALARIAEVDPPGFVVNAEKEYKSKPAAAIEYMSELMDGIDVPVYLSTYRYPEYHRDFPWAEFGQFVDGYMPQVYWVKSYNPVWQLQECLRQYAELPYPKPRDRIVPTGCAYPYGSWKPTPAQITAFLDAAKNDEGLPGANFWEWKYAYYTIPSLWDAISDFYWGEPVPPPPPPGVDIVRITASALNMRDEPYGKIVGKLVMDNLLKVTKTGKDHRNRDWYYSGDGACFASWWAEPA